MGQAHGQPWASRVSMRQAFPLAIGILLALVLLLTAACNGGDIGREGTPEVTGPTEQSGEPAGAQESNEGPEDSAGPGSDSGGDQEPPRQYKRHETYDEVRDGVRLVLSYLDWAYAFTGRVENTTDETLTNVRVVIHTSYGATLGTEDLMDLAPGEIMPISSGYPDVDSFGTWTAYPEVDADAPVEFIWPAAATKILRPPIQDFVELLDIRLDRSNFTGEEVLEACRYIADPEGSENPSETAQKAVEGVRRMAEIALYPESGGVLAYAEIDPLPNPDEASSEELDQWGDGFTAWLTPQIDELMGLFCPEVFARHERGVNVIGQLPHPGDVTGVPTPQPLTQEDVKKFYRSLPPSGRSDPHTISYYCGLLRKHNWDRGAVTAELKELEGPSTYHRAPIYWWYELAGFVIETSEWERWVLQEYDLPQDRRRWQRLDEWVTYWDASHIRAKQLVQMFCEEYE